MSQNTVKEAVASSIPTRSIEQVARKFVSSLRPEVSQRLNGRLERGLEMARNGAVRPLDQPRCFLVRSSDGKRHYEVDLNARSCTCPDSHKGNVCKHRIAAYYIEQARLNSRAKVHDKPRPTCSVPPEAKPRFKPTCSVPPTREDFRRAEMRARAAQSIPAQPSEELPVRRFLKGKDLEGQACRVEILAITRECVVPHPSQEQVEKWCLWVRGLPQGLPNAILFGTRGMEDLCAIFGELPPEELKGKHVVVYPKALQVAGVSKTSIRFRGAL